jgi:MFS family permease
LTAPASTGSHTVSRPSPIWACLVFTFINSAATGVTFSGIPFINREVFHYGLAQSSALGVMLGVTYIFGAMYTGPFVRWAERRWPWCTHRTVLAAMMLAGAALNALPTIVWFSLPPQLRETHTQWALWVFVALYSVLCGGMWPIVESFMSGGRGPSLPSVIGRFNVVWSTALVLSLCLVPGVPLAVQWICSSTGSSMSSIDAHVALFGVIALFHLGALLVLQRFEPNPGSHDHTAHATPPSYAPLLRLHRALMPISYLVCYALTPYLPTMFTALAIREEWQPIFGSMWLAARPLTFYTLDRWQGWHGTRFTAVAGSVCVLGGFAACVGSTLLGPLLGVPVAAVGLLAFGAGMAMIYVAALYYAMEVGAAAVDEGGKHEALIGMGYTVGPLCGLGGAGLVQMGLAAQPSPPMLALVAVASLGGGAFMLWRSRAPVPQSSPSR